MVIVHSVYYSWSKSVVLDVASDRMSKVAAFPLLTWTVKSIKIRYSRAFSLILGNDDVSSQTD